MTTQIACHDGGRLQTAAIREAASDIGSDFVSGVSGQGLPYAMPWTASVCLFSFHAKGNGKLLLSPSLRLVEGLFS